MAGEVVTITQLIAVAHANAVAKGFYDPPPTAMELIALCHSELSEALEAYRDHGFLDWVREDGKPEGLSSELADTVIRLADMAGHLGIDLEKHIATKVAFNATRPHRHGGKRL